MDVEILIIMKKKENIKIKTKAEWLKSKKKCFEKTTTKLNVSQNLENAHLGEMQKILTEMYSKFLNTVVRVSL